MKNKEKQDIINNRTDRCDCSEDDNCGCSFPNNTLQDYEAETPKSINQADSRKNRSASKNA